MRLKEYSSKIKERSDLDISSIVGETRRPRDGYNLRRSEAEWNGTAHLGRGN